MRKTCGRLGIALVRVDVVDGMLDRGDFLGLFIRNLGLEFFLKGHDQLDSIQGVSSQIVYERCVVIDFVRLDTELFSDDRSDLVFDTTHAWGTP